MTPKLVAEILEQSPCEEFTLAIEVNWQVWRTLDEQIARLEARMKQQAQADPNEAVYRSAPGFGPISSRVCANELGNLKRFSNERKLFSYTGLTPREDSSGEKVHRGHITKQGNRHIRGILIEAAWRAIRLDPALARFYQKVCGHAGAKRAIVAVARKLIGRIRAAFCKGELYQIDYGAPLQETDHPPHSSRFRLTAPNQLSLSLIRRCITFSPTLSCFLAERYDLFSQRINNLKLND